MKRDPRKNFVKEQSPKLSEAEQIAASKAHLSKTASKQMFSDPRKTDESDPRKVKPV